MHLPWQHQPAGDTGLTVFTSVTADEATVLKQLAAGHTVLEIGSAYGYTACVMALAGAESVTAVDPHAWIPGSCEVMLANLAACGAGERVTVIRESSFSVMPELAAAGTRFGLVFVDGDHAAAAVRHDLRWALQLLEPGGTLAVHDYLEDCCCPGVREATDGMFPEGGTVTGSMMVIVP